MAEHGVPEPIRKVLASFRGVQSAWGAPARTDRVVTDGEIVRLGDQGFRVHHRPGHSKSDTLFHDEESGLMLSGDHLLGHISSNALIAEWEPLDGQRAQPLLRYRQSLSASRTADVDLLLPGHGSVVEDHRALIDRRLAEQDERAESIASLLRSGPQTAYELAVGIWGDAAMTQAYLTLSEVLGHLDLLLESGRAVEARRGELTAFEAVI
jgi:glyoxylase-like metal-dependent hydrolase (beta-lactamase superfamily II)